MKIVYCLIDSSQAGGMERSICSKANYLADVMHYDVTIVTTDRKGNPNFFDFSPKIHFFDLGINYNELNGLSIFKRLKNQLKKRKNHRIALENLLLKLRADVVISTCTHEISILCKIKDGSRKIAESHLAKDNKLVEARLSNESVLTKLFILAADFHRNRFLKYYDAFVVLSESEKEQWKGFNHNIVTIPNPLSFFSQSIADYTQKRVISVGRLSKEKGFNYLIDAWQSVYKKYPDWELVILGDGEEKARLQAQVLNLGLENNIHIYPSVKNISQEYLKSSLFVMPSLSEAFGLVLPEAMSSGLPSVIFNNASGIIKNGEDGFLVETENIDKLAERIILLLGDENLRRKMGQNARLNSQRFLSENIMPGWISLFKKINN